MLIFLANYAFLEINYLFCCLFFEPPIPTMQCVEEASAASIISFSFSYSFLFYCVCKKAFK